MKDTASCFFSTNFRNGFSMNTTHISFVKMSKYDNKKCRKKNDFQISAGISAKIVFIYYIIPCNHYLNQCELRKKAFWWWTITRFNYTSPRCDYFSKTTKWKSCLAFSAWKSISTNVVFFPRTLREKRNNNQTLFVRKKKRRKSCVFGVGVFWRISYLFIENKIAFNKTLEEAA